MAAEQHPSVEWQRLTAPELNALAGLGATVLLPVASTEQHGPHLGTGVDAVLCAAVCKRAAEEALQSCPVVVAPTLWVGMAEHHMAHGGTFTLDVPTYRAVLLCLVNSLKRHGFKRILIVNGHGGNMTALNAFLPDIARETGLDIAATTYFELAQPAFAPLLEDQQGVLHACEAETSMMMAIAPESVRSERISEAYGPHFGDPRAVLSPPAQRFRSFADLTPSGVLGDARKANPEKGQGLIAAAAAALAALLVEGRPWR